MSHSHDTTCPKCSAKLRVNDDSMGVPGGLDKEQGYCPVCHTLVAEFMTSGFIRVELVKDEKPR